MAIETPRMDALENNLVINGHMPIAQRPGLLGSNTGVGIASADYAADRFFYSTSGAPTGIVTHSHEATAPAFSLAGHSTQNSARVEVTTLDAAPAAADLSQFQTAIEGYNIQRLFGKDFLVYFFTRTNKAGTYPFFASNSGQDRTYTKGLSLNGDSLWQRHCFLVPAETGGVWNFTSGAGLRMGLTLMAGSNFLGSDGVWNTGTFQAGLSGQVNFLENVSNFIEVTNVMVLPGTFNQDVINSINFIPAGRDISDTIYKCQRFFEKSWDIDQAVGFVSGPFNTTRFEQSAGGFALRLPSEWQRKRTLGVFDTYSGLAGTGGRVNINGVTELRTASSHNETGGWAEQNTVNPANSASFGYMWTVESEIFV
jgi:hypothetical protein